jgi:1-acyl-sn-glycerol-3-phosphate acyltransferase
VTREDGQARLHARAREKGVNPLLYWLVRAVLQPVFHLYFRLSRIGREHIPESGPVILCANHRSFLDPFVIGTCLRRPVYYVAKQELFRHRSLGWLLNALGAFPVARGAGDQDMLTTAKAILARGDVVVMFAEGTRVRPGALGRPKRGVGRLALETGAPVVPVAVIGTEAVRNGWRFRPHKVRIRIGGPLTFPKVERASAPLAAAVTDRIWPNVMLQWEWLGGLPPVRRAAVIGAAPDGAALAAMLTRAGVQVDQGAPPAAGLAAHDLVCFAVPAEALPAALEAHGAEIPERAGVLVLSRELVPPGHERPSEYVARRTAGWAVGAVRDAQAALEGRAPLVLAAADAAFRRQVSDALSSAGFAVRATADVAATETGIEAPVLRDLATQRDRVRAA